jgi:CMP-N-acetylneuraminic acid synthetase
VTVRNGIGFVPARGGSKGIKDKNLALLAGKTLLQHAIDAGIRSGVLSRAVVSSDSAAILAAAERLGGEPLLRPQELASDTATTDSAITHFISALGLASQPDLPIVLLQPTSPLRTAAHVAGAMEQWLQKQPRCVVSVFEPREHPAKSFRLDEDGFMTGFFGSDFPFSPRQNLPRAYMPNGAIYIFSVAAFLSENRIPRTGLQPFVMDSESSIDIDCMEDLRLAERCLLKRL